MPRHYKNSTMALHATDACFLHKIPRHLLDVGPLKFPDRALLFSPAAAENKPALPRASVPGFPAIQPPTYIVHTQIANRSPSGLTCAVKQRHLAIGSPRHDDTSLSYLCVSACSFLWQNTTTLYCSEPAMPACLHYHTAYLCPSGTLDRTRHAIHLMATPNTRTYVATSLDGMVHAQPTMQSMPTLGQPNA